MAEGNATVYNSFKEALLKGECDLDSDTLKIILVDGGTPDIDADASYSDIASGEECSGTGYTAGGETLANPVIAIDSGSDLAALDADDVTWSSLDAGTPTYAILYDDTHATDQLIAYWELGRASNGGDYTLQWNASGIVTLT